MDKNSITAALSDLQIPSDRLDLADAKPFASFVVSEILVRLEKEDAQRETAAEVLDWRQYN